MRIAFIARATLFTAPGGDTKQIEQTAAALRQMGVAVDVFLTGQTIDYAAYDLLHFFNIIRPADILPHLKSGKPFVVSTIFVDYSYYEQGIAKGMRGRLSRLLGADRMEWLKAVARWLKNGEKIRSAFYLFSGHRAAVKYVARKAAMLLPNSESEYRRFVASYGVKRAYRVVPNGIDVAAVTGAVAPNPKYKGAVLCLARIEGLKNQLRLIQALKGASYPVFIHGKPAPNAGAYAAACKAAAGENIHLEGWLQPDEIYAAYAAAKVHVLPSFFETTGLSSLEAAAMGCNIVVSPNGDTRDYFGDFAWYCKPEDPASIRAAVDAAYAAPYDERFREHILACFTWQQAAEATLAAYREVLKRKL